MVVLVCRCGGTRAVYTSASFSGQSDFASQKSCICAVTHVTKSACPTDAEKCLPTTICPHSRWRSQPLSRVSRKQRYNTLDFAEQNRVPTGMLRAPIGNPASNGIFPSELPIFSSQTGTQTVKTQLEHLLGKCKRKSVPMSGGLPFLLTI